LHRLNLTKICFICTLAGLLGGLVHTAYAFSFGFSVSSSSKSNGTTTKQTYTTTNRPWGNVGPYKQAPKYEKPATAADMNPAMMNQGMSPMMSQGMNPGMMPGMSPGMNSGMMPGMNQGMPPGMSPAMNRYYPGAASPAGNWYTAQVQGGGNTAATGKPRVEISVSDTNLFEQQNVVYTARVISSDNLKTLDPVMPTVTGAVLEKIDGPVATSGPNREIINEYRFKLTPLQSGEIEIPAITFKGTHAGGRHWSGFPGVPGTQQEGESFTATSSGPIILDVMPADPTQKPWLPLNDLKVRAKISDEQPFKEGKPVTVTLELTAKGALGEQLPSLEQQLDSDQYRIYRDAVNVKDGVSKDGRYLIGTRKETYTLIPLKDGWVRLPYIKVGWWDVDNGKAMVAELPDQAGESFAANRLIEAVTGKNDIFSGLFWAPLLITLGLIAGYWLGVWSRGKPALDAIRIRIASWSRSALQHSLTLTGAAWKKVSPVESINKLRYVFMLMMPRTVKLWMCTRCLEREENPEMWCTEFKQHICQHLGIAPHTPLTAIAEKIIDANPQAEPARIRALVQSLDGAIYGGRPLDFALWKQEFHNQLRPRLSRRHRRRVRRSKASLPALNPRTA